MTWLHFFTLGWGRPVGLYVLLQIGAVMTLKGPARIATLFPVLPMSLLLAATFKNYAAESNLWPIGIVFAVPPWVGALVITWSAGLALQNVRWARAWALGPPALAGAYAGVTRLIAPDTPGDVVPIWRAALRNTVAIFALWLLVWACLRFVQSRRELAPS